MKRDDRTITLVCTDRGQHRKVPLATAFKGADNGLLLPVLHYRVGPDGEVSVTDRLGEPVQARGTGRERNTVRDRAKSRGGSPYWSDDPVPVVHDLKCPKCPRHFQFGQETWRPIFAAAVAEGLAEIDVSRLPF